MGESDNADLRTRGWELAVAWNDRIGESKPFGYGVKFTIADNQTEVTKYNNPNKSLDDFYKGMKIGEIWGYVTEGLFVNQADIDAHVDQSRIKSNAAGVVYPGDIKFKNLDGDNAITPGANRVGDSGDRKIIGNSEPRYMFGLNLNADWNNFFVSAFFQGANGIGIRLGRVCIFGGNTIVLILRYRSIFSGNITMLMRLIRTRMLTSLVTRDCWLTEQINH